MQVHAKSECFVIVHGWEFHSLADCRKEQTKGLMRVVVATHPRLVIEEP
jgi:hypothetical protein